jgi:hypothetical protein
MEKWNVSPEDAPLLLSGISNRYYHLLKSRPQGRILSTDRLYRIPYQIGIYKALHIAYGDKMHFCRHPLAQNSPATPSFSRPFPAS